jgi:hypothetical protein
LMRRLGSSLRCLCWLVEGSGFQGSMVRGVLTGVKMFGRLPFETHVSTDMAEALRWTFTRLDNSKRRFPTIPDGMRSIAELRLRAESEPSAERSRIQA